MSVCNEDRDGTVLLVHLQQLGDGRPGIQSSIYLELDLVVNKSEPFSYIN